jgi:diketogulonate reductase-like aldo/keto reductase
MRVDIPSYRLRSNYPMPAFGLGTWQLSGEKCERAVRKALELGYTHIDTAEVYENESEIGSVIGNFPREGLFITSKVMPNHLHYDDVIKSCERSLKRLKTPYLDLYLIHWPSRSIPIRETFRAMKKLHDDGKVRSIGVSNFDICLMENALEEEELPISVNQVEFHPYLYQEELLEFCKEHKVVLTAYSPIARGNLIGDGTLLDLGRKYGKTPSQISLRWLLQKETVVIPKATSAEHLRENREIFDWKLSDEDVRKIDSIGVRKRYVDPFRIF